MYYGEPLTILAIMDIPNRLHQRGHLAAVGVHLGGGVVYAGYIVNMTTPIPISKLH
jgi:hypothetical protein